MNIKDTWAYRTVKAAYITGVHTVCDARRRPFINGIKATLMKTATTAPGGGR